MTIGIFLAIYIVLYFAITMFGFLNPVMMLVTLGLSIVVGAIPFMLFLARVKHAGMVALFTIVLGILLLVIGFPPLSIGVLVALAVVLRAKTAHYLIGSIDNHPLFLSRFLVGGNSLVT